jgi:CheY-like chemotaxis protein
MARILISEPNREVSETLERMVWMLGHEAVMVRVPRPQHLTDADLYIVEPSGSLGMVLAHAAKIANPSLPVIASSVDAPPPELAELGVVFAAWLLKPYTLEQLRDAIELALGPGRWHQSA